LPGAVGGDALGVIARASVPLRMQSVLGGAPQRGQRTVRALAFVTFIAFPECRPPSVGLRTFLGRRCRLLPTCG
jgi:hypothetical protein